MGYAAARALRLHRAVVVLHRALLGHHRDDPRGQAPRAALQLALLRPGHSSGRKNREFLLLEELQAFVEIFLLLHVQFVMKSRKFGLFTLFSPQTSSLLVG